MIDKYKLDAFRCKGGQSVFGTFANHTVGTLSKPAKEPNLADTMP